MSGIDMTLENIKNQLNDLRQEFTQARKKGFDVTIPSLRFQGIPAKIGVVKATQSYSDLKNLMAQIEEVQRELKDAEGIPLPPSPPSLNHEDDAKTRIQALLLDIERAKEANDMQRLTKADVEIRQFYPKAPLELKKDMYKKAQEISELLKSAKRM